MTSVESSYLIDVRELSRMLKVGIRTVWRLLSSRKIPEPIRVGSSVRWRYQEVVEWINQGCPCPKNPVDKSR